MEHLWSRADANPRRCLQRQVPRKPYGYLRSASVSCIPLPGTRDGKEGVDGSSPSEGLSGSRKSLQKCFFVCRDGHCGPPPWQGGDRRCVRSRQLRESLQITTLDRATGSPRDLGT